MIREKIAFDIDDVLAGTTEALRAYVNDNTGLNLTYEDYTAPATYTGYYQRVWSTAGITDHSWLSRFQQQMGRDQSNILPSEGSKPAIDALSDQYDLVAVTSREPYMEEATRRWVHDHFGSIFDNFVLLGHAHTAVKSKGDACRELGAQYLVDDHYAHCQSALAAGIDAVLYGSMGWQAEHKSAAIDRCQDMPAVLEYFNGRS